MKLSAAIMAMALVVLAGSAVSAASQPREALEADVPTMSAASAALYEHLGAADDSTTIQLTFALTPRNADKLEQLFWEVSDPQAANYGAHLSLKEVVALVAPSDKNVQLVSAFLKQHNAISLALHDSGDMLSVELSAADAADALQCGQFHAYRDRQTGEVLYRALTHYTLPAAVSRVVDFVGGVHRLPKKRMAVHRTDGALTSATAGTTDSPIQGFFDDDFPEPKRTEQEQEQEPEIIGGFDDDFPLVTDEAAWPVFVRGGNNATALIMARCADNQPTSSLAACNIEYLNLFVQPEFHIKPDSVATLSGTELSNACRVCSGFDGEMVFETDLGKQCAAMRQNAPVDSLFCLISVDTVTVAMNNTVELLFAYQDGTFSDKYTSTQVFMPFVTPQYLAQTYGIGPIKLSANPPVQAVVEFSKQYYSPADLQTYFDMFHVPSQHIDKVVGPNNASAPGLEASLDVQVIMSVAQGVPTQFWSTAGLRDNNAPPSDSNQEPFFRWITHLADTPNPPIVNSLSYDDDEPALPRNFTDRLNYEFMKAGVRGLSLFFCAGDDGVGGINVRTGGEAACPVFVPAFPACSPYVTAVGGSEMGRVPASNVMLTQTVSDSSTGSIITTGGGFSTRYGQPEYQRMDVRNYFNTAASTLPPSGLYNASGRGYPDVTGLATDYLVTIDGTWWQIGGTSASTPLVAAMASLINDQRVSSGKPVLGFVNPLLYSIAGQTSEAFGDVVFGNNRCSAVPSNCCTYGFNAAKGWDPTSGLGWPVFNALADFDARN